MVCQSEKTKHFQAQTQFLPAQWWRGLKKCLENTFHSYTQKVLFQCINCLHPKVPNTHERNHLNVLPISNIYLQFAACESHILLNTTDKFAFLARSSQTHSLVFSWKPFKMLKWNDHSATLSSHISDNNNKSRQRAMGNLFMRWIDEWINRWQHSSEKMMRVRRRGEEELQGISVRLDLSWQAIFPGRENSVCDVGRISWQKTLILWHQTAVLFYNRSVP